MNSVYSNYIYFIYFIYILFYHIFAESLMTHYQQYRGVLCYGAVFCANVSMYWTPNRRLLYSYVSLCASHSQGILKGKTLKEKHLYFWFGRNQYQTYFQFLFLFMLPLNCININKSVCFSDCSTLSIIDYPMKGIPLQTRHATHLQTHCFSK